MFDLEYFQYFSQFDCSHHHFHFLIECLNLNQKFCVYSRCFHRYFRRVAIIWIAKKSLVTSRSVRTILCWKKYTDNYSECSYCIQRFSQKRMKSEKTMRYKTWTSQDVCCQPESCWQNERFGTAFNRKTASKTQIDVPVRGFSFLWWQCWKPESSSKTNIVELQLSNDRAQLPVKTDRKILLLRYTWQENFDR